jgi:hypothetical protein
MAASHIYKVVFVNQGKVYEIYARKVGHGPLFGFVEVEEIIFGERSAVVVDPSEERIKAEFEGVKRTYLPMHSVLRIDEVRKSGVSKISTVEGSNVTQFRTPSTHPATQGHAASNRRDADSQRRARAFGFQARQAAVLDPRPGACGHGSRCRIRALRGR